VDDSKRTSIDASDEADEDEPRVQKGNSPVKGATQTAPELSDTIESGSNVVMTFDCMCYATPCACPSIGADFVAAENLLPAWHSFALHPQLYAALYSQNFVSPTPIQSQAIPKASSGCDVIGVAETVSDYCFVPHIPLHLLLRARGKLSLMACPFFTNSSPLPLRHRPKRSPVVPYAPWFSHPPVNSPFKSLHTSTLV